MKMLVTGVAGFIGSHVAEWLLKQGHLVMGIDDLSGGFLENVPPNIEFHKRSVLNPLDDLLLDYKPDVVYHLAAYAAEGLSHHIPVFNYQNNLIGTTNVLSSSYRAGTNRFVFTSSIAAYGHPSESKLFDETTPCHPCDPYGNAKLACELQLEMFNKYYGRPKYTIFRPHNVFGIKQNISDPYRNVVGIFIKKILEKKPLPIFGDGTQTRSFSYINVIAQCIAESGLLSSTENQIINIGGDQSMSVKELAQLISDIMGVDLKVEWLAPRNEVAHAHCKHDKARVIFRDAYKNEISISEGLKTMIDYIKKNKTPKETECPSLIEIIDKLPPSWLKRMPQNKFQ